MEYLTISKLHVNKLSEANSSSCWKWLKIIHRGNSSEIYSFQISENKEHFVASSASVCHFFFAKNRNTQLLCCGLELPIRGFTESILCSLLVWKWNAKKSWKQLESARPEGSHWSKLSFLFILVIARVIERVDTLAWRVLPGKMFLLERLKHVFSKSFCCILFFRAGMTSVFMALPRSPLHISISWPTKVWY